MRKMRRKGEMDWKDLMSWAFVLISVVVAIAVPVGIHLSNNNKKPVPTNTPEPGGTGPPVQPIVPPQSGHAPPVPPPIAPQSGQAPPVPPIVLPSVQKKYTYAQQGARNESQTWGCPLKDGIWSSINPSDLSNRGRLLLEKECSERAECVGYYDNGGTWIISTDTEPEKCGTKSSEKYPIFYRKKEV